MPDVETGTFASECVTRLLERLAYRVNAAAHSHDERAVHELRVAIRRFGQSLTVFKSVFSAKEIRKMRRRLDDLMDLSADVRDCDIALVELTKSELPGVPALREKAQERRKEAVRMLLPALRRWAARRTTSKWRAALTPNGDGYTPLSDTARERLPRIAKKFLKEGDQASSATELHHVRIEAKKLRYSLEIFQPAVGAGFAGAIDQMKRIQSLLGKVHDCHAVRQLVDELGGDGDVEAWLKKRQRRRTREFREAWPDLAVGARHFVRMLKHPPRKPVARAAVLPAKSRTA